MPNPNRTFTEFLADPAPALQVKFASASEEEPIIIRIKNKAGAGIQEDGRDYLCKLCQDSRLNSFFAFYEAYDGECRIRIPYYATAFIQYTQANCKRFRSFYR
jgi:hypothetical protein